MSEQIILAILTGSFAAAIVTGATQIILWMLNNKKKGSQRDADMVEALQLLMYNEIKAQALKQIACGSISADCLEDLERMHRCYHDKLDGNGYLSDIMKKVRHLPISNDCRGE